MTFTKLLRDCQRSGKLTVGDLRIFFNRNYYTVRRWALHGTNPSGPDFDYLYRKLERLHGFIVSHKALPIVLKKPQRAEYMRLLGEGQLGRARLLVSRSARQPMVRSVRKKRESAVAKVVSKHRRVGDRHRVAE